MNKNKRVVIHVRLVGERAGIKFYARQRLKFISFADVYIVNVKTRERNLTSVPYATYISEYSIWIILESVRYTHGTDVPEFDRDPTRTRQL